MEQCAVCGVVVPVGASICGNCLSPQPVKAGMAPEPAEAGPMKRCAACGEESPLWARFCGSCREPFAPPADNPAEITMVGASPSAPEEAGSFADQPESFAEASGAFALAHPPAPPALETSPWRLSAAPASAGSAVFTACGHTAAWYPPAALPAGRAAQSGPRQKPGQIRLKIIAALVATALVVTIGGVTLAYFLTRPEPVIQVTSALLVGKTPAGSPAASLQVSGQNFSHHSSVMILLDGQPAPGVQNVLTDGSGDFHATLAVTEAWRYGFHTLTATDARGYTTRSGVRVDIIPSPVITVQSQYQQGGVPAGATSTTLHVSGKWFSYRSRITFLLDGQPVPGSQGAQSDAQGRVEADLTVTDAWKLGNHTLTAEDAQGYATQRGWMLTIVQQGEADTPGPNGAPADDASFTLAITIQPQAPVPGDSGPLQATLLISGQPDPAGGTVCQQRDNDQPYTMTGTVLNDTGLPSGLSYQETLTSTCSGSYKSGHLSYTETVTSDQYILSNGLTCQAASVPYTLQELSGSFDDATSSSGNWNSPSVTILCEQGLIFLLRPAEQGTWSATLQQ
jgi:hypothetical protein